MKSIKRYKPEISETGTRTAETTKATANVTEPATTRASSAATTGEIILITSVSEGIYTLILWSIHFVSQPQVLHFLLHRPHFPLEFYISSRFRLHYGQESYFSRNGIEYNDDDSNHNH